MGNRQIKRSGQKFFRGVGIDSPNAYRWMPTDNAKTKFTTRVKVIPNCTATPGSQGEDNDTTYVYKMNFVDGMEHHLAYVECDYVQ